MNLSPYLTFSGKCEEAFKFYQQALGGEIRDMITHGSTPACEHVPKEWHGKIMHASLTVDDFTLMGSDNPPEFQEEVKGMSVAIGVDDPVEAERVFNALSQNAAVHMPIQETFWATRFGMLVDQYGIPWMINCAKPE